MRCLNYTRPTLHCSIDNHIFFMTTPTRNIVYCLVLLAVKPVNLFLWVKVYVAFNDLRYLKILLWESKMSIKISSLKCMEYIQKTPTQYIPLIFLVGEHSVPYFKQILITSLREAIMKRGNHDGGILKKRVGEEGRGMRCRQFSL